MPVISWIKNVFENKRNSTALERELKPINDHLIFMPSQPLTLGVEFELALLDGKTLKPAHRGPAIIEQLNAPTLHKETLEHMLEITTTVCRDVHEAHGQMQQSLQQVQNHIAADGLLLCGTGWPPILNMADCRRTPVALYGELKERYKLLREDRQIFTDRFSRLSMHMHLGMTDAESCIRYSNFFMHFIPHLLALSAGSPFENGVNTGLAAIRPTVAESLPTAGSPYYFDTWQEYRSLTQAMFRAGSIQHPKDQWWDIRPCPRYGTLEIRICDQPATLEEAMAIVAFTHALALWFEQHQSWLNEMPRPNAWRARENKWRAIRYGLDAKMILNNQGDIKPLGEDILQWLERLDPIIKQQRYEPFAETIRAMLAQGNSAKRQQRVWEATNDLEALTRFCCQEFKDGKPAWLEVEDICATQQEHATAEQNRAVGSAAAILQYRQR